VLAEESGASGSSEYTWIIDPLDGTTNFIHGFPQYAVSIALRHRDLDHPGGRLRPERAMSSHCHARTWRVPERATHPRITS